MPVFDGKHLTEQSEGEAMLAMILHPTPKARAAARERGRMRLEVATMLPELAPSVPGTTLATLRPDKIQPVT